MQSDDLTARLRATFVQELDEQVRELNTGLLALEQHAGDADAIRSLFRSAHTVKGAARVAGVPLIEAACHALEAVFAAARDGTRPLGGGDFSLLFAVVDGLADAGVRLRREAPLDDAPLAALLPRINVAADLNFEPEQQPDADARVHHPDSAAPPQDTPRSETEPATRADAGDELVRVSAERLDALLAAVGELVIATGRIVARQPRDEDVRRLDQVTDAIGDVVHRLRLRSFAHVCEGLPRAVRDVAASGGRDVELELGGQDVEADRLVMDALREPLLHLVRNAVDHGIEPPAERLARGKPATGKVRVAADLSAGRLHIVVQDDGRGLDEPAIGAALRRQGRNQPADSADLIEALLGGGVSTREHATAISGRGVGLDIVRSALERIGGAVDVSWRAGAGTTFTLECPPSPAMLRAVLVRLGSHTFALPTAHVERLERIRTTELRQAEGRVMINRRNGAVPVFSLAALLGPPLEPRPLELHVTVAIVTSGARTAALVVDAVLDEDQIVMRPLTGTESVPAAAGAAILPSGVIALVLSVPALLARTARAGTAIAPVISTGRAAARPRILVADDSITTRTLEQSVLEAAGYNVRTAVDGAAAWEALQEAGADLLIADVEMPRMDGITLCRRVRASARFASLPIVLVTGLASAEDRARGLDAGADAYIIKSNFDQANLLDTINQLIGS